MNAATRVVGVVIVTLALLAAACGDSEESAPDATDSDGVPADLDFLGALASADPESVRHSFDPAGSEVVLGDGSKIVVSPGSFASPTEVEALTVELALSDFAEGVGAGTVYRLSTAEDVALAQPIILEIAKPADSVLVAQRVDGEWSSVSVPAGPTTKVAIAHFSEVTTSVIDKPDPATTTIDSPTEGIVPELFLASCLTMFVSLARVLTTRETAAWPTMSRTRPSRRPVT